MTHDVFEPLLNTWFRMHADANLSLDVELIAVEPLPPIPGFERRPFRLVFRSRDPQMVWPQRTYRFTHERMEDVEIFVVPRGPDQSNTGMTYDATFS